MFQTMAVVLVAMIAVGSLEIWLFLRLADRHDRRQTQGQRP